MSCVIIGHQQQKAHMRFNMLTAANPKTQKGMHRGYLTYVLHLAPSTLSGLGDVCPQSSAGCRAACLNTAGRGGMFRPGEDTNRVQQARIRKTRLFFEDREQFMSQLVDDVTRAQRQAIKLGLEPVFRLNATSDLQWERYTVPGANNIFELFPDFQFYDYTKILGRKVNHIPNYHVTFSQSESNHQMVQRAMDMNLNVAVAFDQLPDTYLGRPVINGDRDDLRFLDPHGCVVGLKAKGRARRDHSGFVIRLKNVQTI